VGSSRILNIDVKKQQNTFVSPALRGLSRDGESVDLASSTRRLHPTQGELEQLTAGRELRIDFAVTGTTRSSRGPPRQGRRTPCPEAEAPHRDRVTVHALADRRLGGQSPRRARRAHRRIGAQGTDSSEGPVDRCHRSGPWCTSVHRERTGLRASRDPGRCPGCLNGADSSTRSFSIPRQQRHGLSGTSRSTSRRGPRPGGPATLHHPTALSHADAETCCHMRPPQLRPSGLARRRHLPALKRPDLCRPKCERSERPSHGLSNQRMTCALGCPG